MNTAEILRAAAARVRQGWCQEVYDTASGKVCAVGAIGRASGIDLSSREELRALEDGEVVAHVIRALNLPNSDPILHCSPVPQWNDAEGQTAENVATGLEYAALVWELEQAHAATQYYATAEEHAQ